MMKKIYFLLVAFAIFSAGAFAQQAYIKVPSLPTTTSTVRGPNGTSAHGALRGCYLLSANEMSVVGTNTAINAIGFFLNSGTNGPAVTGTIQIYLQNTNDVSYSKGFSFSTAIAPMTSVYNSTMIVPSGLGANTITIPLPSPFTYTGNGLYIAYEWVSTGPFATTAANYQCDNTMASGGAFSSATIAPAPDVLTGTNTRPVFRIGYINTYTNEAQVYGILGNGRQPLLNGFPYSFSVVITNNSGVAINNVVPTLSISGANSFVTTTTISSIAAGAAVTAAFPGFSATAQGMNTVNVTIPNDDNNNNNSLSITQSITCNYLGYSPPVPINMFNLGVGFSNSSGLLLSKTSIPNTSTLNAVRLGIANYNPNSGNSVYGVITDNNGVILATTNTVTITGPMFGTWQQFNFASPVTMNGGTDYFIGMAQPANTLTPYFPLATMPSPSNNIGPLQYGTSFIGGGFIGIQTPTLGYFAIEGVFANGVSVTVTPQSNTICSGNSVTITASGATSYSWSNGASTSSIVVSPNLFTAYTCTGTAIVGTVGACGDVKTSNISVNISPTINCSNGALCPVGGSYTLNPTGTTNYTYSGGGPVVSPSVTTQYTITGMSGAGCAAVNTVVATVSVSANASLSITGPTMMCAGTSTLIYVNGAQSYTWNTGSNFSGITITPSTSTTYSVSGMFGSCTGSAALNVSVSPNPTLSASSTSTLLCAGQSATLVASGAQNFSWTPGGTGNFLAISPTVTTTYTLVGNYNNLCSDTITFTQMVHSCVGIAENSGQISEIKVYPNPNSGEFTVYVSSLTDNSLVQIYNGLGQLLVSEKLNETSVHLNLRTLPKGLYIVKLKENDKAVRTTRVVIQ
jgi:hypothetical protein